VQYWVDCLFGKFGKILLLSITNTRAHAHTHTHTHKHTHTHTHTHTLVSTVTSSEISYRVTHSAV